MKQTESKREEIARAKEIIQMMKRADNTHDIEYFKLRNTVKTLDLKNALEPCQLTKLFNSLANTNILQELIFSKMFDEKRHNFTKKSSWLANEFSISANTLRTWKKRKDREEVLTEKEIIILFTALETAIKSYFEESYENRKKIFYEEVLSEEFNKFEGI